MCWHWYSSAVGWVHPALPSVATLPEELRPLKSRGHQPHARRDLPQPLLIHEHHCSMPADIFALPVLRSPPSVSSRWTQGSCCPSLSPAMFHHISVTPGALAVPMGADPPGPPRKPTLGWVPQQALKPAEAGKMQHSEELALIKPNPRGTAQCEARCAVPQAGGGSWLPFAQGSQRDPGIAPESEKLAQFCAPASKGRRRTKQ